MTDIMKALIEATGSMGGYLVPDEFSNRLLALIQAKAVIMQDCDIRQMAGMTQFIPKVTDGSTAYWPAEQGTISESAVLYGQITLSAKKVAALTRASTEVLEDNNVNVADALVEQMGTDIALAIDAEMIYGTTAFTGLQNTASIVQGNAVDATGAINMTSAELTTGAGLTASQITIAGIQSAIGQILQDNHEQPDVSYWNPKTLGQVQALTDSTTRPILNMETYGSPLLRDGITATLIGTRVKTTTQMPTTLDHGSTSASGSGSCADAMIARSKMFAFVGQRRGFIWKTDYDIHHDVYRYQTTMRLAFALKYPNAYCMIRAIID